MIRIKNCDITDITTNLYLSFKKFHEQEKSCTGIKLLNHTDWANQKNINDAQSTT